MKNLLWYLIAGTKGGETRGRIIELIKNKPSNANKIAEILKLDYKTVRHHLEVLEKNNVIIAINKGKYGAVYFLSELMEPNMQVFGQIWAQFGKK
ncbi:winged helix-turn-helix transcriptional regulator [Candidatus Woesearchaeota archaeon]|nr:winged helix-turn-helix transcriptional regulator [Candidatus Woesearchaeota archaeon]